MRATPPKTAPKRLYIDEVDLIREGSGELDKAAFPDQFDINGVKLPLIYQFEPGVSNAAAGYFIEGDTLYIDLKYDSGTMKFSR